MQFTLIDHAPARDGRLPLVTAILVYQGEALKDSPLSFVVDSAAERTIITPQCEARLKFCYPNIPWNDRFEHGAREVRTVLGSGYCKRLLEDKPRKGAKPQPRRKQFALAFEDDGHEEGAWLKSLDEVYFADERRRDMHKNVIGDTNPYSILGHDVLAQCGLVLGPGRGLLTPNTSAVQRIMDAALDSTT